MSGKLKAPIELYRPDWTVLAVSDIPFRTLATEANAHYYIFDYHNTLAGWPWGKINPDFQPILRRHMEIGSVKGVAIASNVIVLWPPILTRKIELAGEYLGAAVYCFGQKERKPKPEGLRRIAVEQGWDPEQTVVVGEQYNDVLGAHLAGYRAILVKEPVGYMPPWVVYKHRVRDPRIRHALSPT